MVAGARVMMGVKRAEGEEEVAGLELGAAVLCIQDVRIWIQQIVEERVELEREEEEGVKEKVRQVRECLPVVGAYAGYSPMDWRAKVMVVEGWGEGGGGGW